MSEKQDAQLQTVDPGPSGSRRRRILVVDDNQDAADSLALLLELDGHEVRARSAGFDHHLTKPIDPDRLAELISAME